MFVCFKLFFFWIVLNREPFHQQVPKQQQLLLRVWSPEINQPYGIPGHRRQHQVEGGGEHLLRREVCSQSTVLFPLGPYFPELLLQRPDHGLIGGHLFRFDSLVLDVDVKELVESEDILVVSVQVQEGVQEERKVLPRRHLFRVKAALVFREITAPYPGAHRQHQGRLAAEMTIDRSHADVAGVSNVVHGDLFDGPLRKDGKGGLYDPLLPRCQLLGVLSRFSSHGFIFSLSRK